MSEIVPSTHHGEHTPLDGLSLIEMQRMQTAHAFGVPMGHEDDFVRTGVLPEVVDPAASTTTPEQAAIEAANVADIVATLATGGTGARIHARREQAVPARRTSERDLIMAYFAGSFEPAS